jgi:hypothetical protein
MFDRHRLTPPSNLVFFISLVLAVLAVVSEFFKIPSIGPWVGTHRFWIVTAAYALLAAGVLLRGM